MTENNPLDEVEVLASVANVALMVRHYYDKLVEQGFTEMQAYNLAKVYVHGLAGGKISVD